MKKWTIFLLSSVVLAGCSGSIGQNPQQPAAQISEALWNQRFCEIVRNTQTLDLRFTKAEAKALRAEMKRDLGALKAEYKSRCEAQLASGG